jgi:4-amino-4-deoxy-L-arabinose transferase-like glycosyltransferase
MAPPNKCLARSNKSRTGVPATNKRLAARRNSSARRQFGETRCGVSVAGLSPPERKLNMSCLYSTACVYGVTALTVAIWLIPLLIILWLWRKTHIRRTWVPLLFFLGLIFLIQGVSALIGPNELMALAYILAGAAK